MGNWRGTCGISHLPIENHDSVVLFIIQKNKYANASGGGFVQTTDQYVPICPALYGNYNEAGSIYDMYGPTKEILEFFNSIYETKDKPIKSIKTLIDDIERGNYRDIGFMLVHKKLYLNLIEDMSKKINIQTDETMLISHNNAIKQYKKRIIESGESLVFDKIIEYNSFYRFTRDKMQFFRHLLIENDDIHYKSSLINIQLFVQSMEKLRRMFIPQVGSGDFDTNYKMHKIVADFSKMYIKERENDHMFI